jgi:hypothetical protein
LPELRHDFGHTIGDIAASVSQERNLSRISIDPHPIAAPLRDRNIG